MGVKKTRRSKAAKPSKTITQYRFVDPCLSKTGVSTLPAEEDGNSVLGKSCSACQDQALAKGCGSNLEEGQELNWVLLVFVVGFFF